MCWFVLLVLHRALWVVHEHSLLRRQCSSSIHYDAKVMADLVWRLSAAHLFERNQPKRHLFRIFFYDTPVFTQRVTLPVSRQSIDLSKSKEGQFRAAFQRQLQRKRKLAVKLGEPMNVESWKLNEDAMATEKLAEGIRLFCADAVKLEALMQA